MIINNRSKEKLGVGIVGLGHVATHQVDALRRSEDFMLLAACDHDSAARETVAAGVDTYENLGDMLGRSDLDAVIVATPNKLHVEHGVRVMEAGKRLVIEKPVAETKAEFEILVDVKRRQSADCTVALHAAFGVEVDWFVTELENGRFDELAFESFHCQFYDPYISKGRMEPGANSLGGSWIDSGINALSVVCRLLDPASLAMTDSRMRQCGDLACHEIKGSVDFSVSDRRLFGSGTIETDWTTGRNKKVTSLGIAESNRKLILDHSEQAVIMEDGNDAEVMFKSNNGLPRLTNHYIGVFKDLARQMELDTDNLDYCRKLHDILYQAETWDA
ncbi:MAG: Gfo/Idh/MocA family protein [Woeseiaceae bacterium]